MPEFSKTYFYPKRSRVVWAFWSVVLLGIPFWYLTTYTYRAALPHEEMEAWEQWGPRQPFFPVQVMLVVKEEGEMAGVELAGLAKEVEERVRQVAQKASQAGMDGRQGLRMGLDMHIRAKKASISEVEAMKKVDTTGDPGSYTIYLYPLASTSSHTTSMVIGRGRGMVMRLKEYTRVSMLRSLSLMLIDLSSQEDLILQRISQGQGTEKSGKEGEEGRKEAGQSVMMRWAPTYQVLFSLMVEDPRERVYGWEIGSALDEWLSPFLHRMDQLSHLEVTTQVQYFTAPLIQPHYHHLDAPIQVEASHQDIRPPAEDETKGGGYWYYDEEQLPGLIDTTNWQLASTISQAPALHHLLFLPAKSHRPLHIHTLNGTLAATDAFLIPQWGGIVLHQLGEDSSSQLSSDELEPVLSIFRSQLRDLLGVQALQAPRLEVSGFYF